MMAITKSVPDEFLVYQWADVERLPDCEGPRLLPRLSLAFAKHTETLFFQFNNSLDGMDERVSRHS